MNWKQQLAEAFGYKSFEEMDTSDQRTAEKAVELYQNSINYNWLQVKNNLDAKKQNDCFGVPGISENPTGENFVESQAEKFIKKWRKDEEHRH